MKKQSKFLSLILRHKPETIGITLDSAGWVAVKELLTALNKYGRGMKLNELKELVATGDKRRFAFSEDGKKIRASQGHSINVNLGYEEREPPDYLYHGTVSKFLDSIYKNGIQKMKRHHVHLSEDVDTATNVGNRRGNAKILLVNTKDMFADGYKFYVSANGVWLTDHILPKYFHII